MCDINSMSREDCLGPKQAQLSNAQIGLADKGRAIKVWLSAIIGI